MLTAYPRARAWYSFTLRDSEHLSDGTPLREVVTFLEHYPQTVAVGINCIALQQATAALQHLHGLTALPLVVYPNSGEHYDASSKSWHHHDESCSRLADYLPQWQAAGGEVDWRVLSHHARGYCRAERATLSLCRVWLMPYPALHHAASANTNMPYGWISR